VFNDAALTSGTLLRLTSSSTSGKLVDLNFTNTTGTIFNGAYGASTTQGAGALTGLEWDMNTNLSTPAAGQNLTGIDIKLPTATTTSNATVYNGLALSTAGAVTNGTAGSFAWHGVSIQMPNITQSAGGSVSTDGLIVNTGSITTGGSEDGLDITATGVSAGTLNGINISNITAGAGTQNALVIGSGWNTDIAFTDTAPKISIGNTGILAFTDGTNTLLSIVDEGTYGALRLPTKGSTGDPATCTAGDVYFNGTDNVFKGCTATNTWTSFSQNNNVKIVTQTLSQAVTASSVIIPTFNVTITPNSATSQVLLNGFVNYVGTGTDNTVTVRVYRGATNAGTLVVTTTCGASGSSGTVDVDGQCVWTAVDSPATTSAQAYSVYVQGTSATGTITNMSNMAMEVKTGADLAELYSTNDDSLVMTDVVSIDPTLNAGVQKSTGAYDQNIMGVVSTAPNVVMGAGDLGGSKAVPVALSGRVPVKVTDENGPIQPGDYLVASSTPGVAMKATHGGMVLGQAMTAYDDQGTGAVGVVTVFLKNSYLPDDYFNLNIAGLSTGTAPLSDTDLLAELKTKLSARPAGQAPSDFSIDRLSAGTSVVSPNGVFEGLSVDSIGSVHDAIAINSDTIFFGRPYFNSDTAGFAKIYAGNDHVDVTFNNEYSSLPIVNATISLENVDDPAARAAAEQSVLANNVRFIVSRVTTSGFSIVLNSIANSDIPFSWTAFAVKDAKTFTSNANTQDTAVMAPTPTASTDNTPTSTVSDTTPTDVPTDTNTPTPAATAPTPTQDTDNITSSPDSNAPTAADQTPDVPAPANTTDQSPTNSTTTTATPTPTTTVDAPAPQSAPSPTPVTPNQQSTTDTTTSSASSDTISASNQ